MALSSARYTTEFALQSKENQKSIKTYAKSSANYAIIVSADSAEWGIIEPSSVKSHRFETLPNGCFNSFIFLDGFFHGLINLVEGSHLISL